VKQVVPSVPLEEIFGNIRAAQMVVMVSDESDEAEGDLVMAAEKVTPAHVNFMVSNARGIVSVAIPERRFRELGIPLVASNQSGDFVEQAGALVEARKGVTTGISAGDRARTIQVLSSDKSTPEDIGMRPAATVCAILCEDGEAARLPELREFAQTHSLPLCFVKDLVSYRLTSELLVQRVAETDFTLPEGELNAIVFRNIVDGREHLALVRGNVGGGRPALVRLHSECLTGDVFGSNRCDCGEQLKESIRQIIEADAGVIIYLHQEGRGIGLGNKIKAYALQDQGLDTVEANLELGFKDDLRDYGIGAQILRDLGVGEVRLLTNNPHKIEGLERYGVSVTRVSLEVPPHHGNIDYLRTKKEKLGHLFTKLKVVT
jgi:3,4-dihydroxy 2-butanone 4-phosphate synthase/GTP cyclohydrolase II